MSLSPTGVLLRSPVLQSTGTSLDHPMSQKATTDAIEDKVPSSRTINDKPLSSNLTLNSDDVGALPLTGGTITGQTTFKVDGVAPKVIVERSDADTNISLAFKGQTKTLYFGKGPDGHLYYSESEDIALGAKLYSSSNRPTASELGMPSIESLDTELGKKVDKTSVVQDAGQSITDIMSQKTVTDLLATKVPSTLKINGKALDVGVTLVPSDLGAVPASRTINSKALVTDITLAAEDVNAFTKEEVTSMIDALPRLLGGTEEPTAETGKVGDWYIVY